MKNILIFIIIVGLIETFFPVQSQLGEETRNNDVNVKQVSSVDEEIAKLENLPWDKLYCNLEEEREKRKALNRAKLLYEITQFVGIVGLLLFCFFFTGADISDLGLNPDMSLYEQLVEKTKRIKRLIISLYFPKPPSEGPS